MKCLRTASALFLLLAVSGPFAPGGDAGEASASPAAASSPAPQLPVVQMTEQRVVKEGETLVLKRALYRNRVPGIAFVLERGATLRCEPGAVIEETTAPANENGVHPQTGQPVFTIVADAGYTRGWAASSDITIEGCTFRGANPGFHSGHPTVFCSNVRNCRIAGNRFENTRSIGAQIGGAAVEGRHAENGEISGNTFLGVASQNAAITNCRNCRVVGNTFLKVGQAVKGAPGVSVIDIEPNTGDVVDNVLIADNLIDCSECAVDHTPGVGPKVTNAIVVNGGNPTRIFRNVRVTRNTIIGRSVTGQWTLINYAGILLRTAKNTEVSENKIYRTGQAILADYGSADNVIRANQLFGCGSGSDPVPIRISDSVRHRVEDNLLSAEGGGRYDLGERSLLIAESGTSDFNTFKRNRGKVMSLVGKNSRAEK